MQPVVVWAFTDGKAGHENQTRGLLTALAQRQTLDARWISVPAYASVLSSLMTRRFLPGVGLPPPAILIGAGHRTHLPMLAARRAHGGRSVVLMKPSLPRAWFDLCAMPEHDVAPGRALNASSNVLLTRGALNGMMPGTKNSKSGLILIGGASRHYSWREKELVAQVQAIVQRETAIQWTLTTSRRTPASTTTRLQALAYGNLTVVPVQATGPGWLAEKLAQTAWVWATEDSVSMVYEALTAGCATGVLPVPRRRRVGKIARGIAGLADESLITHFDDWQKGRKLTPPAQPFNEAARVAAWIVEKWLSP